MEREILVDAGLVEGFAPRRAETVLGPWTIAHGIAQAGFPAATCLLGIARVVSGSGQAGHMIARKSPVRALSVRPEAI